MHRYFVKIIKLKHKIKIVINNRYMSGNNKLINSVFIELIESMRDMFGRSDRLIDKKSLQVKPIDTELLLWCVCLV